MTSSSTSAEGRVRPKSSMATAAATLALSEVAWWSDALLSVGGVSAALITGGRCFRRTRLLCTFAAICCANDVVSSACLGSATVRSGKTTFLLVSRNPRGVGERYAGVNGNIYVWSKCQFLYRLMVVLTVLLVLGHCPSSPGRPLAETFHDGSGTRSAILFSS